MSTKCKTPAQDPMAKGQFCLCNEIGVPGKSCQVCGKGTVPNEDHTKCVSCGRGFPNSDGETCTMCGNNEYLNGEKCSTCGKNKYLKSDSSGCDTCPTGTYANEGSTECTVCGNVCSETDSTCPACGASTSTDETKLSEGAIAGIVIGSLLGAVLLGGIGYILYVRSSTPSEVAQDKEVVVYNPLAQGLDKSSWRTERSGSSRSNGSNRSNVIRRFNRSNSSLMSYDELPGEFINTER